MRGHVPHSGSPILSRLAVYYPDRFEKYAFLDIGYQAPGQLATETVIKANQEALGYQIFFNEDGSGHILDQHVTLSWIKSSQRTFVDIS